ncbi:MAG: ABC transporter ATP-binding protein [Oscillospiraceae bacterium]|nr:ABC transporter ATP-binding protein [Oscillospiraceae bacterium]
MKLELGNIVKKYGDKTALNGVSATLEQGIYGLLGPNGAGKSTMMNIITGNLRPDSGSVRMDGGNIRELGWKYRSLLGYAPQQQGLYDAFSGRRFLAYMATLKNIPRRDQKAEIERVLSYVNLTDAAKKPIGAYSGGMKQRILIAQAILGDPKIVVLDEPTAGLDPKERVRIREKIKDISGDKIILVSTHVVSDIQSIADEIILLKSGEIADRGSVGGLCEKYGADDMERVYMKLFGEDGDNDKADPV